MAVKRYELGGGLENASQALRDALAVAGDRTRADEAMTRALQRDQVDLAGQGIAMEANLATEALRAEERDLGRRLQLASEERQRQFVAEQRGGGQRFEAEQRELDRVGRERQQERGHELALEIRDRDADLSRDMMLAKAGLEDAMREKDHERTKRFRLELFGLMIENQNRGLVMSLVLRLMSRAEARGDKAKLRKLAEEFRDAAEQGIQEEDQTKVKIAAERMRIARDWPGFQEEIAELTEARRVARAGYRMQRQYGGRAMGLAGMPKGELPPPAELTAEEYAEFRVKFFDFAVGSGELLERIYQGDEAAHEEFGELPPAEINRIGNVLAQAQADIAGMVGGEAEGMRKALAGPDKLPVSEHAVGFLKSAVDGVRGFLPQLSLKIGLPLAEAQREMAAPAIKRRIMEKAEKAESLEPGAGDRMLTALAQRLLGGKDRFGAFAATQPADWLGNEPEKMLDVFLRDNPADDIAQLLGNKTVPGVLAPSNSYWRKPLIDAGVGPDDPEIGDLINGFRQQIGLE